jgi:class 3 adenylate cyclase
MRCSTTTCQAENLPDALFCAECGGKMESPCPACGVPNTAGANFCRRCGAALVASQQSSLDSPGGSPSAGRSSSPASYTPKHLADKILQSKSALEGERKQVTVLFADVKGSMELAEQLDPEQWHAILDRFFAILSEGVHRFEGTVNQYTGDGIMALFGAPIAHEDHAQRACLAALHLRDTLRAYGEELRRTHGVSFSARVGLNSGAVIVGKIGDDLRMDYTAQGHTVGLAQRMEQLAEPGVPYLTGHTAHLVDGYMRLRSLGEFTIKGAKEPLPVYALEGLGLLRTRFDLSRARGLSKFVGRDAEMQQLEAALERATRERGEVIGVVAAAGTGKSRLCFEFAERCRARGIPVREAHCVSHGRLVPYLPILELLRTYFGIGEQDGEREARQKIAGALLLLDRELEPGLPMFFDFLGVPDPERPMVGQGPAMQRRLFGAVRRVVEAEARRQPGVVLMEDLHWIDDPSAEFLTPLIDGVLASRGLLLTNFRPEFHAHWMERTGYRQIPLQPFGRDAVDALLADLLGSHPSVAGLGALLHQRTGGTPFFLEEVVRELAESGALEGAPGSYRLTAPLADVQIPATVQAVLAARIDRLAERDKGLLQTASVIGKEFSERALREVSVLPEAELHAALAALVQAELLVEQQLYPEPLYAFFHPLTQEVAYASQLIERRRRVHAALARTLGGGDPEQLDERAALIAHHFEGAGDNADAARWLHRAQSWLLHKGALGELGRHDRKIVTLLDGAPETEDLVTIWIGAATSTLRTGLFLGEHVADADALLARAEQLAQHVTDPWVRAAPTETRALLVLLKPDWTATDMCTLYQQACDIVRASADAPPLVNIVPNLIAGNYREALTDGELLHANWRRYEGKVTSAGHPLIVWRYYHAMTLMETGQLAQARDLLDALGAEGFQYPIDEERFRILLAELCGDTAGTLERGRRAMATIEGYAGVHQTQSIQRVAALEAVACSNLLNARWQPCADAAREALAIAGATAVGNWIAFPLLAQLAEAELGMREVEAARRTADAAVARMRKHEMRGRETRALLARARVLVATAGASAAAAIRRDLDEALALCERNGTPAWEPLIREEVARLHALCGEADRALREQRTALDLYTKLGATGHVARLRARLAS